MTEISCTRCGDYLLPNITLREPPPEHTEPLGRYGRMHRDHLRENQPTLYSQLLLSERLYPLCREVDKAAAHRLAETATREAAHEVILSELIFN